MYRRWFISQILSASGLMTQTVAAAWLVLEMTGRAIDLSFLSCATLIPVLLCGAPAGVLIDRFDRRRILLVTQTAALLLGGTLFVLTARDVVTVGSILLISGIGGIVNAVDNPARQVYVLDVVGGDKLVSAVSLYEVVINASRVVGPAIGGALLVLSGPAVCFLVNALSFIPPILVLLLQRPAARARARRRPRPHVRSRCRPHERGAVGVGIRYAFSVPEIRACIVLVAAAGLIPNGTVLYPLLASEAFGLDGGGYGALLAAFGVGAVPGALLAARAPRTLPGRAIVTLAQSTATSVVLTALAPTVPLALVGMAATGLTSIWFFARANALVQLRAAPALRGRVMGVWAMALPGMIPVVSLVAGVLADWAGIRVTYAAVGVGLLVAAFAGRSALRAAGPLQAQQTEHTLPLDDSDETRSI